MTTRIKLTRAPDRRFAGVARIIAKDEAPEWLVLGLRQFALGSATPAEDRELKMILARLYDAAGHLIKWLPLYSHLPWGMQCPADVTTALDVLPRIKKDLARVVHQKRQGRRPNVPRRVCAAVVVEAWKLLHGKAEPRSQELQRACEEYWRACTGDTRGDAENWRRDAEQAVDSNNEWIRKVLVRLSGT
jgi:hypothetical protein